MSETTVAGRWQIRDETIPTPAMELVYSSNIAAKSRARAKPVRSSNHFLSPLEYFSSRSRPLGECRNGPALKLRDARNLRHAGKPDEVS